MKKMYMHTIEGQPAKYYPGKQICYLPPRAKHVLVSSLAEVRQQQEASKKWREMQGFSETRYSYVCFYI